MNAQSPSHTPRDPHTTHTGAPHSLPSRGPRPRPVNDPHHGPAPAPRLPRREPAYRAPAARTAAPMEWDPHPAPRELQKAPAAAHVLGMIAIGLISVVFAPVAIPVILWIRFRDRRDD